MTQIDNPEKRIELRKRVWVMLMRSSGGFDTIETNTNERFGTTDTSTNTEKGRNIPLTRANLAKMVVDYAVNVL
jgi:hypothetical protein